MKKRIYFDYAATTPVDPRVVKAMMPYYSEKFGNTASLHTFGLEMAEVLEKSRKIVAQSIEAEPEDIIFTGSATESNNLALKGIMANNLGKKLLISAIEHDCVLESAEFLKKQGFDVDKIGVDSRGLIDFEKLEKMIDGDTALVSIIYGNNEIGVIQDIKKIAEICHKNGAWLHVDAVQVWGKLKINVKDFGVDLLTGSSHKIYGPKGAAFLYVKKGIKLEPQLHGGGHEDGRRSSTVNIPAIVGMAKAIQICQRYGEKENERIKKLRDYLEYNLKNKIKGVVVNGEGAKRLPNISNISFAKVEGEGLLMLLDGKGIAISTGSACSSRSLEPSHVLTAMGRKPEEAHGSIRFSLGRSSKKAEIEYLLKVLPKIVYKLRKISPYKI